ncbi:hypothetical protein E6C60_2282 [Paenibacillus algicola]|uniref:Uncharacterized protein n=1 Tax=Paenibacillus algicola TaxID=2565926 RepID=A0A4V1G403_9BACL|nr:hypothetical protein [Paenibacillus algicola]QCT02994.1 hypothetical protein E6C60_2282 [Paenibacillus algicola]
MNDFTIVLIIIVVCVIMIVYGMRQKKNNSSFSRRSAASHEILWKNAPAPPPVADRDSPAYWLSVKLSQSLPQDYIDRVKHRVMNDHPALSDQEYEWRWVELQRFFILCAVLKQVPMFSSKVDEIWHEMLMFTRDYQAFSQQYLGDMLHHAPSAAPSAPIPDERAWFDTVYTELFGLNAYSQSIWGSFFKNPLPKKELESYLHLEDMSSPPGRFNQLQYDHMPEARTAIEAVVQRLHQRLVQADQQNWQPGKERLSLNQPELLLASAVYFSWHEPEQYSSFMMMEEEARKGAQSHSSCSTGVACSSNDSRDRDSGNDNGSSSSESSDSGSSGSDSGGSSCSSCGGGCSS